MTEVLAFIKELAPFDFKPRSVQRDIDGIVYTSDKFSAYVGFELGPRLGVLLGSAFRGMATGTGDGLDVASLTAICDRAMRDGLAPTVDALLSHVKCNKLKHIAGQQGDLRPYIGEHFAGEYVHLLKVCAFVIAHNFRGPSLGGR